MVQLAQIVLVSFGYGQEIFGSVIVQMRENFEANELVEARIVYVQTRRSEKQLAILLNETRISAEDIIRFYGKRCDIYFFFMVYKSYLALAQKFQGFSHDKQIATTSKVRTPFMGGKVA